MKINDRPSIISDMETTQHENDHLNNESDEDEDSSDQENETLLNEVDKDTSIENTDDED